MKVGILINDFPTLVVGQTTTMMAHALALSGDDVFVFAVDDVWVRDANVHAIARGGVPDSDRTAWLNGLKRAQPVEVSVGDLDAVLIRTNPGRDTRKHLHTNALQMLDLVSTEIINSVSGLRRAGNKLYMESMPAWTRPQTLVCADTTRIKNFVREREEPSVLKPVSGSRGEGVFVVRPDDPNLNALIDLLAHHGVIMAQEFLPEATEGDVRVVVIDGEPLTVDGDVAAIHRIPAAGDFRSNLHAGGHAEKTTLSQGMIDAIDAIGPILVRDGIRFAGLDFIGDKICEVNAFSTGGLRDAERLYQRPFAAVSAERLLGR